MSGRILVIEPCSPETPVRCSDEACAWMCLAVELHSITDGVLHPGETVPAGDCPRCGCDAFPIRPADRVRTKARDFAAVAVELIYGAGTDDSLQHAIDLANAALKGAAINRAVAETLDLHPQSRTVA